MSFNPFEQKSMQMDSTFMDWKGLYPYQYDKNEVDPYTKLRIILMNGAEYEQVWFSHSFSRHCNNNDLRRELASMRRTEQQQQKKISNLKPLNESILETTIGYEHLAVDLTAILAEREPDAYIKKAYDFALLEDFDHLYRYADLLDMEQHIKAEKLIGELAEIMPGRPTISEHRHPFDDIRCFIDSNTADPLTKLGINIITAAEQQTMNYYMNNGAFYSSHLGRKLYQEIGMIEEQHVSHYGSLMNPNCTLLASLLMHEYTECYLYYSCYQSEIDPVIKSIWEQHLMQEIAHLHKAAELLKRFENTDWQSVIPNPVFPELLIFKPTKQYLRGVLGSTVNNTTQKEDYTCVSQLPSNYEFFKYQQIVNGDTEEVPSHATICKYIKAHDKDYRYQESNHPVPELANREEDNVAVGRSRAVAQESNRSQLKKKSA